MLSGLLGLLSWALQVLVAVAVAAWAVLNLGRNPWSSLLVLAAAAVFVFGDLLVGAANQALMLLMMYDVSNPLHVVAHAVVRLLSGVSSALVVLLLVAGAAVERRAA